MERKMVIPLENFVTEGTSNATQNYRNLLFTC